MIPYMQKCIHCFKQRSEKGFACTTLCLCVHENACANTHMSKRRRYFKDILKSKQYTDYIPTIIFPYLKTLQINLRIILFYTRWKDASVGAKFEACYLVISCFDPKALLRIVRCGNNGSICIYQRKASTVLYSRRRLKGNPEQEIKKKNKKTNIKLFVCVVIRYGEEVFQKNKLKQRRYGDFHIWS